MPNPKVTMFARIDRPGASVTLGPDLRLTVEVEAWGVLVPGGGGDGPPPIGDDPPPRPPFPQAAGFAEAQSGIEVEAGSVRVRVGSGPFGQATKLVQPRRWRFTGQLDGAGETTVTVRAEVPDAFRGSAATATQRVTVLVDSPIDWQPSVLRPVFFGHRDLPAAGGLPVPVRVFFPSVGGNPASAEILPQRMPYPMVLFLHGNCSEADHYRKWFRLPATLARSGYVVAVPDLPAVRQGTVVSDESHPDLARVVGVRDWMHREWEHAALLADRHETAVAGHSRGVPLAALALGQVPARALVSLSGEWGDTPISLLEELPVPAFFMWGTGTDSRWSVDGNLDRLTPPFHRVAMEGGGHWDYFPPGSTACDSGTEERGPCGLTEGFAGDMGALFIARYLPPALSDVAGPEPIPATLEPPEVMLTDDQHFFAGPNLNSLEAMAREGDCRAHLRWKTGEGGGSRTIG